MFDFKKYKISEIDNGVKLPKFTPEKEDLERLKLSPDSSNEDLLLALVKEGFNKKILRNNTIQNKQDYIDRIDIEFNVFKKLGLVDYLLITWDIINFCKKHKIATGLGRGSAAGCLILFLVDVTRIDSLKMGCFFERFLNEARCKFKVINNERYYDGSLLMDVDLDIEFQRRQEVVAYLENKYKGQTSKLLTVSTFSTKILLKDVSKIVANISEDDANDLSEMIPKIHGVVQTLDHSKKESQDLTSFLEKNSNIYKIFNKLYQLNKNFGIHPSAIVLSAKPINEYIPLQLTKENDYITSYEMEDALNLACKVDILGLRCCSHIDATCKLIGISPDDIDLEDPIIYQNLQELKTPKGLFQIEAETNYKVLCKIKPKNLNDLSAVVAIARPGALQFTDKYAKYSETREYQTIHPFFDDIFGPSGGLCLYQEDLLRAANKIGFTLGESEILRRIVGKKKLEDIKEWKQKIEEKIIENKLPKEVGEIYWKIAEDSASYSFNRAHSVSYAATAAITTYLKFKYPKEFFVTLLNLTRDEPNPIEEISIIAKELSSFGIKLLPPHILKSKLDFTIEGNDIRFGLQSIKSISEKSIEKLNSFRNQKSCNKFELFQAANEAKIPLNIMSALIMVGSLDDQLTQSRSRTFMEACLWNLLTSKEKQACLNYGQEFNFNLTDLVKSLNEAKKTITGKPIISDKRRLTLRKKFEPYFELYNFNKNNEDFSSFIFERKLLGYNYSNNIREIFASKFGQFLMNISEVKDSFKEEKICFIGTVKEIRAGKSKEKQTPYLRMTIEDEKENITVMMFDSAKNKNIEKHILENGRKLEEGDIVIISGKKMDSNTVFAETIGIQDWKIIEKISQLEKEEKSVDSTV